MNQHTFTESKRLVAVSFFALLCSHSQAQEVVNVQCVGSIRVIESGLDPYYRPMSIQVIANEQQKTADIRGDWGCISEAQKMGLCSYFESMKLLIANQSLFVYQKAITSKSSWGDSSFRLDRTTGMFSFSHSVNTTYDGDRRKIYDSYGTLSCTTQKQKF